MELLEGMRNLSPTIVRVLPPCDDIKDGHCMCVDNDTEYIWILVGSSLYRIYPHDGGKVYFVKRARSLLTLLYIDRESR